MLAVTGYRTTIVAELAKIIPDPIVRIAGDMSDPACWFRVPPSATRFLLAAGVLHGKRIQEQSAAEITECFAVNCVNVVRLCEHILDSTPTARIAVIGSQSGIKGSFDQAYAVSKAAVHGYVAMRHVTQHQQIVAVAPEIISDSGMTWRRSDYPDVLTKRKTVTAAQVARIVKRLLYGKEPLSNCIVPVEC